MMYLLSLIISTALSMLLPSSPLPLGIMILFLALMTTSLTTLFISSWFSMIIFLIYIGGLMVLFSYFLATQPNHMMTMSPLFIPASLNLGLLMLMTPKMINPLSIQESLSLLSIIMSTQNTTIIILLGGLLLIIMIIVVNMTSHNNAPLRPHYQ